MENLELFKNNEEVPVGTERNLEQPDVSVVALIDDVSRRIFEDNPAGQDLIRRKLLRGVTDVENMQLEAMLKSAERKNNIEIVPIYHGSVIEVDPNGEEKILMTNQLNGCVATVMVCETKDGRRIGQLTHFPDFMNKRQQEEVENLLTPDMKFSVKKKVVLFFQQKRSEGRHELKKFFEQKLGLGTEIDVKLYSSVPDCEANGVIVVRIPSIKNGEAEYLTWEGNGKI